MIQMMKAPTLSQKAAAALYTTLFSLGVASAQTLDVEQLNADLENSLTSGRDAAKNLTCTATMVFFASDFMKFVFGGMLLITLVLVFFAWYNQQRNGVGMGRLFWIIVVAMALVALIGTIVSNFMGCS